MEHPQEIGVIDDSEEGADMLSLELKTAQFEPHVIGAESDLPYRNIDDLIEEIGDEGIDFVICDYRLDHYDFARFNGAELAVRLYEEGIPTLLLSEYLEEANNMKLRTLRDRIPVVLPRSRVSFSDRDSALEVFNQCLRDIGGTPPPSRRPYRTVIQVLDIDQNSIDVVIPQWDEQQDVSLLEEDVTSSVGPVSPGDMLFAEVNLLADEKDELFFRNFETAPDPSLPDELA